MTGDRKEFEFQPVSTGFGGTPAELIDQVVYAVRSRFYRVGDVLPTAREIARQARVSSGTVSAALKLLESHDVVRSVRGNRGGTTVVREDIPAALLKSLSRRSEQWRERAYDELVQARLAIERPLALLAASNSTEHDFAAMEECLHEMADARSRNDLEAWTQADHRFHYAVGNAGRNAVLARYQHEVLTELSLLIGAQTAEFDDSDHVVDMHRDLVNAMRSGDREAVAVAMRSLIDLAATPPSQPT